MHLDRHVRVGAGVVNHRSNCSMLLMGAPLVFALGVPALAADLAVKAPAFKAPIVPPYSWTGWYIGANAGYGVGDRQGTFAFGPPVGPGVETFNSIPAGGFGGGQL